MKIKEIVEIAIRGSKLKIGINDFVKRQTESSRFAHYNGNFEDLIKIAEEAFTDGEVVQHDKYIDLIVPRVVLLKVNPAGFYTSVVKVDNSNVYNLVNFFESRREGEEPFIASRMSNIVNKEQAKFASLILYSHRALSENKEQTTSDCDFEIVSINASLVENEPMHPITMARNQLQKTGGTKSTYTAEQWAEAVWYWKDKVTII